MGPALNHMDSAIFLVSPVYMMRGNLNYIGVKHRKALLGFKYLSSLRLVTNLKYRDSRPTSNVTSADVS